MKTFVTIFTLICFCMVCLTGCGSIIKPKDNEVKFARIPQQGYLGGVCAGMSYYFGWQTWTWRAIFVASFFLIGTGIIPYVILWAFVPVYSDTPKDFKQRTSG